MNRYQIVNKTDTHASLVSSPTGDWVHYQEVEMLEEKLKNAKTSAATALEMLNRYRAGENMLER